MKSKPIKPVLPSITSSGAYLLFILPAPLVIKLFISILSVNLIKTAACACALVLFYSIKDVER